MSEPHTADLATRYRYRREGAEMERERIIKLFEESDSVCSYWALGVIERSLEDIQEFKSESESESEELEN